MESQTKTMTPADLRTARHALNLSQSQLAAALGCSVSSLQDWEQGRVRVPKWVEKSLEMLRRLQRVADSGSADFCRREN